MLEINLHPFPVLQTERLVLRQVERDDVHEVFFMRSNAQVLKYIDREPCPSVEEAMKHIDHLYNLWNENEGIAWAVSLKENRSFIGSLGIFNMKKEHYRAEFGYSLHPNFHRQGIMKEASVKVLDYVFNKLKLHSLEANVSPENVASVKLLESLGFIREGYFKENYYFKGRFLDTAVYGLISPVSSYT